MRVFGLSARLDKGTLALGPMRFQCALGRSGRRANKREGDGATPCGRFRLVRVLYRSDRRPRPRTGLPVSAIGPDDGWCDAAGDRNYNRPVRLPYPASAERMWREDGLYDLVVVLDHNTRPRMRGAGSAIFLHVARTGFRPTEGCVALSERTLERLLFHLGPRATIGIG
jgi:L,D-peptidoglycan transpeptidase YkuD (ErfK/YbiS/YcfS/YnhG family)